MTSSIGKEVVIKRIDLHGAYFENHENLGYPLAALTKVSVFPELKPLMQIETRRGSRGMIVPDAEGDLSVCYITHTGWDNLHFKDNNPSCNGDGDIVRIYARNGGVSKSLNTDIENRGALLWEEGVEEAARKAEEAAKAEATAKAEAKLVAAVEAATTALAAFKASKQ